MPKTDAILHQHSSFDILIPQQGGE